MPKALKRNCPIPGGKTLGFPSSSSASLGGNINTYLGTGVWNMGHLGHILRDGRIARSPASTDGATQLRPAPLGWKPGSPVLKIPRGMDLGVMPFRE